MRTTCVSCMFYLCMWQINQRRCVLLHCYSICGCSCMWCDVWLCVYLSYAACRAIYWFLAAVINNRIYECPQKSYAYASLFPCFLFSLSISLPPSLCPTHCISVFFFFSDCLSLCGGSAIVPTVAVPAMPSSSIMHYMRVKTEICISEYLLDLNSLSVSYS